jgi:hypothetical protein
MSNFNINTNLLFLLLIVLFSLYYFNYYRIDTFENSTDDMELLVFLTEKCPHCTNYVNNVHAKLENELKKDNIKIKKVYDDNLFDKYNVSYVPKGLLIKNNIVKDIDNGLTIENVKKAISSFDNSNSNSNSNSNNTEKVLMVFLTKQCPHCVTYTDNVHTNLENELKKDNINIKKIYKDDDKDGLFEKHDIKYVPKAMLMIGNETKDVNKINADTIKKIANDN